MTVRHRNPMKELLAGGPADLDRYRAKVPNPSERPAADAANVQLDLLVSAVQDYAILTLDPAGHVTSWNLGAQRIKGYSAEEIIGRHFSAFYPPEDVAAGKIEAELAEALTTGRVEDEGWRVRKDGSRFWANVVITAVFDHDGELLGFVKVTRDMTERKRSLDQIETARAEAERANRAKDEFLSHMSHELRTPLNAVIGFAQILQMDELVGSQRDAVSHIEQAGRHLLGLINEILDISRVAAGELSVHLEPVDVAAAVDQTIGLIRPAALDRGVRLVVDSSTRACALADPQRLLQILLNLVTNAVKYNRHGGDVNISWTITAGRTRIAIADTGPGIAEDLLDRLFTPFDRLGAEATATEGTGIGLFLAKSLTEAMDGTIEVTSEPGRGTTFTLDLAQTPVPLPATGSSPGADIDFDVAANVLYIEDNLANIDLVRAVLATRPGVKLIPALTGTAGIELARTHTPQLVLLDLNLPDHSGEEVLHQLRADPATADLPVAVMSADAEPGRIALLAALGVIDYLTKPIDVPTLLGIIDSHIPADATEHSP
jgi:PAS domain S-box-containing protein